MSVQTVKASDPAVKKGALVYCADHPRGWFPILARWRSVVMNGHDVHLAVKGRGPCDLLDFRPDDEVMIRPGLPAGTTGTGA